MPLIDINNCGSIKYADTQIKIRNIAGNNGLSSDAKWIAIAPPNQLQSKKNPMEEVAGIKNKAIITTLVKPTRRKFFLTKLPVVNLAILSIIGLALNIIKKAGIN